MTLSTDERGGITARVPRNVWDTLQQAAELLGTTLSQFVVQAALSEARRVIERERVIPCYWGSTEASRFMRSLHTTRQPVIATWLRFIGLIP